MTDVAAVATGEGWLNLAVVLDLFSRRAAPRRVDGGWRGHQLEQRPC